MEGKCIYITEFDMKRLREMLRDARESNYLGKHHLKQLQAELDRGKLVSPRDVPPDVITMNSRVCFADLDTGEEMTCTLVFPEDADIDQNKISVLAPIGTAILGYRVGDTIELIYAQSKPTISRVNADFKPPSIFLPLCFGGMGGVFVLIGIAILIGAFPSQTMNHIIE